MVFINFFPFELRFFIGIISNFGLTLFGSFLVFWITFFLEGLLFFNSLSFFLLFLKFPLLSFFGFDLFGPLDVFDFLLFQFKIVNFGFVLFKKFFHLILNGKDLFFELFGLLKKFFVVSFFHFLVDFLNTLLEINNVVLNGLDFAFDIDGSVC